MVDGIYGASEDNSRLDKDQVIRWAFQHIDFDENAGDKALMVGDRWTDADGAKACGLDCLGCGWGYAEPGELKAHGAYRILDSVDELAQDVEEYFYLLSDGGRYVRTACLTLPQAWKNVIPEKPIMYVMSDFYLTA